MAEVKRLFAARPVQHAAGRLAPWQYRKIRDRLAEPGARPDVRELAQLCGISTRHLQRQFAALTGQTLASYIESHQIQLAKTLLLVTDTPIQEIAALCSYRHANSFARAFRRATGHSPLDFRRRSLSPCRIGLKL
jgi:AraC-like DNA-binding protein